MRKGFAVLVWLILLMSPAFVFGATLGTMRVSMIEGDAQIKPADTEDWVPLAVNTPLKEGDRLWAPEGALVEIQLRDGSYVRMNQGTSLDIIAADGTTFRFYEGSGQAYICFRGSRKGTLQLDTPVSSTYTSAACGVMVDVEEQGGSTSITALKGSVFAENRGGRTSVSAGKNLLIRDEVSAELYAAGPVSEWQQWNADRDMNTCYARPKTKYLPEELTSYAAELDESGRWIQVRDYGYVWTPTVYVSAEWTPYRSGRWIWSGGDYVWVGYEPWGWAPYHYGRWSFVAGTGWFWVPPVRGAVYWGPGYVGWVNTPTAVAWVPLAPGEIYYGRGYYGPRSVNILSAGIPAVSYSSFKNYKTNAMVATLRDGFYSGRYGGVGSSNMSSALKGASFGSPQLVKNRDIFSPVNKNIAGNRQVPGSVKNNNPMSSLLGNRNTVTDPNKGTSAFGNSKAGNMKTSIFSGANSKTPNTKGQGTVPPTVKGNSGDGKSGMSGLLGKDKTGGGQQQNSGPGKNQGGAGGQQSGAQGKMSGLLGNKPGGSQGQSGAPGKPQVGTGSQSGGKGSLPGGLGKKPDGSQGQSGAQGAPQASTGAQSGGKGSLPGGLGSKLGGKQGESGAQGKPQASTGAQSGGKGSLPGGLGSKLGGKQGQSGAQGAPQANTGTQSGGKSSVPGGGPANLTGNRGSESGGRGNMPGGLGSKLGGKQGQSGAQGTPQANTGTQSSGKSSVPGGGPANLTRNRGSENGGRGNMPGALGNKLGGKQGQSGAANMPENRGNEGNAKGRMSDMMERKPSGNQGHSAAPAVPASRRNSENPGVMGKPSAGQPGNQAGAPRHKEAPHTNPNPAGQQLKNKLQGQN